MFGILKPCLARDEIPLRREWARHYCDVCGCLGHCYGASTRPLLVFDIVTLDWLCNGTTADSSIYPGWNCLKGGTLFRPGSRPDRHRHFLAAISAFAATLKIEDDHKDQPSFKSHLRSRLVAHTRSRAINDLHSLGFDLPSVLRSLREQDAINAVRKLTWHSPPNQRLIATPWLRKR